MEWHPSAALYPRLCISLGILELRNDLTLRIRYHDPITRYMHGVSCPGIDKVPSFPDDPVRVAGLAVPATATALTCPTFARLMPNREAPAAAAGNGATCQPIDAAVLNRINPLIWALL
jgi:hypothetical protein